jgi:hypothetical protein
MKDASGGKGGIFVDQGEKSAYYVEGTKWVVVWRAWVDVA